MFDFGARLAPFEQGLLESHVAPLNLDGHALSHDLQKLLGCVEVPTEQLHQFMSVGIAEINPGVRVKRDGLRQPLRKVLLEAQAGALRLYLVFLCQFLG